MIIISNKNGVVNLLQYIDEYIVISYIFVV